MTFKFHPGPESNTPDWLMQIGPRREQPAIRPVVQTEIGQQVEGSRLLAEATGQAMAERLGERVDAKTALKVLQVAGPTDWHLEQAARGFRRQRRAMNLAPLI